MTIDEKIESFGLVLPRNNPAMKTFVPLERDGNTIIIDGQLPIRDNVLMYKGFLGQDLDTGEGEDAARLSILCVLAHLKYACDGNLERVVKCHELGAKLQCAKDFENSQTIFDAGFHLLTDILTTRMDHVKTHYACVDALPFNGIVSFGARFDISD